MITLKVFMKRIVREKWLHLMVLPTVIFYIIFAYYPMYGIIIAFKNFSFTKGILGSPWAANNGFEHFINFFNSMYFSRLISNTVILSALTLICSFPVPIIFALLLNEVTNNLYRRFVQSVSYFPYFVSVVITVGIMTMLLNPTDGVINRIMELFGGETVAFMSTRNWFRPLYIISDIWQGFGWGSILYMAALSGVSAELYEAAVIDGANRLRQVWHVSLPGILPTIVIMLILAIGRLFEVGADKILLMYSPGIYDVADVIDTYVFRKSIGDAQFSFATAINLFKNVISFSLIFFVNRISNKVSSVSLW